MLPVIALVGRPNVGKSTLFNRLTQSRDALVVDIPGVTRDRQYGDGQWDGCAYFVIDTGGMEESDDPDISELIEAQVESAMDEADIIFFIVDAKVGLATSDTIIAKRLRRYQHKKIVLLVNKADRDAAVMVCSEFYNLGFGQPLAVSAQQGRGIDIVMKNVLASLPKIEAVTQTGIRIAVVGRPNVGKSTLINRMIGEDRLIVFDRGGTTRDTITVAHQHDNKQYLLIDTAGMRRRRKITETVEKFSVIKTLQAIKAAEVVILVMNAQEGLSDQDLRLLSTVSALGKALVIAFNQWDGMDQEGREQFKQQIARQLSFVDYARRYTISALHGTGVGKLYHAIDEAYESAYKTITTAQLTAALQKAVEKHQPPLVKGRRIKLRYAHMGSHNPFIVVIHGKQVNALPGSYKTYLSHYFRRAFDLQGIPVLIQFNNDKNPYL